MKYTPLLFEPVVLLGGLRCTAHELRGTRVIWQAKPHAKREPSSINIGHPERLARAGGITTQCNQRRSHLPLESRGCSRRSSSWSWIALLIGAVLFLLWWVGR